MAAVKSGLSGSRRGLCLSPLSLSLSLPQVSFFHLTWHIPFHFASLYFFAPHDHFALCHSQQATHITSTTNAMADQPKTEEVPVDLGTDTDTADADAAAENAENNGDGAGEGEEVRFGA